MFFSYNVGSAVVMLFSALLFTLVTVLMGLVLIRVSPTHTHTFSVSQHNTHTLGQVAEWLGNLASTQKAAGSIPSRAK